MSNEAQLQIDAATPLHAGGQTLYGVFFEEINHGGDGGLYAELVRNRSFADGLMPPRCTRRDAETVVAPSGFVFKMPDEPLPAWSLVAGAGQARMAADDAVYLDAANPRALRLEIAETGGGRVGIANAGYWGIAVRAGESYRVRVHARSDGAETPLHARLVGGHGALLGAITLGAAGRDWKRLDGIITAATTDTAAHLVVETDAVATLWFGFVSLFPVNTWKGRANGMRPDVADMLAELKPAFLRFPGGCFVEGFTRETIFDWKATLGDVAGRRGHWNLWGYRATNGLGYHEFLQLCEDLGAAAMYVFNCGMCCQARRGEVLPMEDVDRLVQDTLDAVEYALGPADSPWGARRAVAGHPAPFPLQYLEIGNENSGPDYAVRYRKFHDALRRRHPELHLIADVPLDGAPVDVVDEHYYAPPGFFRAEAGRYDGYPRTGPRVYVGEYAVTAECGRGNWRAALAEAAFLTGLERNADVVTLSSYAPLFVNVNDRSWSPDLIQFDNHRVCAIPSYWVQKLFRENQGEQVLPVRVVCAEESPVRCGGVGFVTWQAQAEFRNLRVETPEGVAYANDLAAQWNGMQPESGAWELRDGVLRQTSDAINCFCQLPGQDWTHYTLTCQARVIGGEQGFMVAFHTRDAGHHVRWHVGQARKQCAMEDVIGGCGGLLGEVQPFVIEEGRWYDVRLVVQGGAVAGYLDGRLVQEVRPQRWPVLAAVASLTAGGREVIVKVVNPSSQDQDVNLELTGVAGVAREGMEIQMGVADPDAENTLDEPQRVVPVARPVADLAATMRRRFPAYSITILRLKL